MNTLSRPAVAGDRDPVAASIEDFLATEMAKGRGQLGKRRKEEGVWVSFSTASAIGPNYDIAFVRLAFSLVDDERIGRGLRAALRQALETTNY